MNALIDLPSGRRVGSTKHVFRADIAPPILPLLFESGSTQGIQKQAKFFTTHVHTVKIKNLRKLFSFDTHSCSVLCAAYWCVKRKLPLIMVGYERENMTAKR